MPESKSTIKPIVTHDMQLDAQAVIQIARRNVRHPFLLDAKLGDGSTAPLTDTQMAAAYDTPLSTANRRPTKAVGVLVRTYQELVSPLETVAQLANDFMARAALDTPGSSTAITDALRSTPDHRSGR